LLRRADRLKIAGQGSVMRLLMVLERIVHVDCPSTSDMIRDVRIIVTYDRHPHSLREQLQREGGYFPARQASWAGGLI
jgi:hypothetical protein